ncbi:transcription factor HES-5-like [Astyanax mexicanus]|uniref:Transcription factor HES-5 n=2 Tax=Astyanax mexicanus TaxID=7994 RepID=A0A8T2MN73_ASTMX|nr:transcription factor HES-5-like [Astyanax mexicanus]
MTPTVSAALIYSRDHLPLSNKLRKPIVEKMRRERINSSMEKLKSLLGGEFLKQQPDSRQEKADILEMTLQFLKQQQQQQSHNNSKATAAPSQRRLLRHFLTMQPSMKNSTSVLQLSSPACSTSSKEEPPASSALWRPW